MFSRIEHDKLLENYKTTCTKIEDLKNIELDALPVHDRYIRTKIRTYGDVSINFHGLNVPEDDVECEVFTIISLDSLLVFIKLETSK